MGICKIKGDIDAQKGFESSLTFLSVRRYGTVVQCRSMIASSVQL